MSTPRPSSERGHAHHGWLPRHHSFSFADDHDAARLGVVELRIVLAHGGADNAVSINAGASIEAGLFDGHGRARKALEPTRLCYIHVPHRERVVNGPQFGVCDGATPDGETVIELSGGRGAKVLVIALACH
jgi:hypothetical protein